MIVAQPQIDDRFMKPFYQVAKAIKMSEIPLVVMRTSDHVAFVDQVMRVLGGTALYASQPDFIEQMLNSMSRMAYLFVMVDEPLKGKPFRLVHAYLRARDVMGSDPSELAEAFNAPLPHPEHRLILVADELAFRNQDPVPQRQLRELCTIVVAE